MRVHHAIISTFACPKRTCTKREDMCTTHRPPFLALPSGGSPRFFCLRRSTHLGVHCTPHFTPASPCCMRAHECVGDFECAMTDTALFFLFFFVSFHFFPLFNFVVVVSLVQKGRRSSGTISTRSATPRCAISCRSKPARRTHVRSICALDRSMWVEKVW